MNAKLHGLDSKIVMGDTLSELGKNFRNYDGVLANATGEPDDVPALTTIAMRGLPQQTFRAYPLVDHVADKTCAILERPGVARRPSTRFKDLDDLLSELRS